MNINVHIDRLILDGLLMARGASDSVQAAVETELTRLLADKGFNRPSAYAVTRLSAAPIQLTHNSRPSSLGHQIAQAIYGTLAPATSPRRETRLYGGPSG
jgi:hypothetical protein